ncbi:MAG: hypothetical protein H5U07_05055 [Candidatus Aminicenantes bacterium]|nr:hypothetical protein [Candidatus Aminicenantes bacterium]
MIAPNIVLWGLTMTSNIDLLLEKLQRGGLAHELVSLLKMTPRERWDDVLDKFLESHIWQKIEGSDHAKNQTPRD